MNRAEYIAGLNEAIAKGRAPQFREMHGPTHAAHTARPPEFVPLAIPPHPMGGAQHLAPVVHVPEVVKHEDEHHAKKGK